MFLTEAEAERRLADLHRERARLERAIADLALFLDIGRRHVGGGSSERRDPLRDPLPEPRGSTIEARYGDPGSTMPLEESGTDRSLARREGRLLMEAAADILGEADRPLHAAEILDGLARRGLSVPGIDPVAALNTRLWKRSGPDGPFQRLGDAVYALSSGHDSDE
ncbi:winged helix-turn-helix domain-containing protein [Methylobacterium marchantiae]|uniref:Winged helix-turn-helix domain-containing protein n=1 Tax=Methylobacterium marchantiae TaxID=600331 RepID=A0ABW3WV96_9HYPH|nr:hypothetical protein AIGOOFII_3317 [Methylobacterium marchantiae]